MNIVNVGYDSTNYYVLGQNDPRLLIDAGWPGTLPKLLAILKRKDIPLAEIRYLLVTHYHPDHAGLVQELKAEGIRLIVLEGQNEGIILLKSYMKPSDGYVEITLNDNIELTFDESRSFLHTIGIAGTIIPTPGHSDDSVTLVLDHGDAFIGDLPSPGFVEESSNETVLQSWAKIRALHAKMIYSGHAPVRPLPSHD
jgi:endoribonuclease LACTB2